MFTVRNLQINRGGTTANAQGQFTSALHSYKDKSQTVSNIISSFPPYFGQGATQDEILVGDLINIIGSDTGSINEILALNPVTLGPNFYLESSFTLNVGAPIVATDANALKITGSTLQAEIADATHPGIMSTGSQTFAGAKTFANGVLTSNLNPPAPGNIVIGNNAGTTGVLFATNVAVAAGQVMQSDNYQATTGGGTIQVGANASAIAVNPQTAFFNGLYFPTSGTLLNYYSVTSTNLQFQNAGNFSSGVNILLLKLGRLVTIFITDEVTGVPGGNPYFQSNGALPGDFVPSTNDAIGFMTSYDGGYHGGSIRVDTSGNIFIYRDADQSTAYSSGNGGFAKGSFTYISN